MVLGRAGNTAGITGRGPSQDSSLDFHPIPAGNGGGEGRNCLNSFPDQIREFPARPQLSVEEKIGIFRGGLGGIFLGILWNSQVPGEPGRFLLLGMGSKRENSCRLYTEMPFVHYLQPGTGRGEGEIPNRP